MQDNIKWDAGNGVKKIVDLKETRVEVEGGGGKQASYIIDYSSHPYMPTVTVMRRAEMRVGKTWVYLHAKSSPQLLDSFNIFWNDFIKTVSIVDE